MAILIQNVLPRSLAAKNDIKSGEKLLSVNGQPVNDFLDLEFYTSDYEFELEIMSAEGISRKVKIQREEKSFLGIEPEPYKIRYCENACIFCFIDQMPPELRPTLYIKDDDYLYSYVFGNYITLTNLDETDYARIINQRITPLYVSLHTTDNALRQKIMRPSKQVDALSV
ncbi:MAG: PDZ domain-containing protein, partial [Candidatus Cloacimonetes bacterium]|nr:PDZ domain-containing protein [Candidatus Cloacimonadota bacterium]